MMLWSLTLPLLLGATQESPAWEKFTSPEGGFCVKFPSPPMTEQRKVKTATGELSVAVFLAEDKNDASYVVSYSDLPAADAKKGTEQKRLDFAREGAITRARGKLKSEKSLEVMGYPGRELVIESEGEQVVRLRIFLVNRRLYQVMAVGPGAAVLHRDGTFFLDSFRLSK